MGQQQASVWVLSCWSRLTHHTFKHLFTELHGLCYHSTGGQKRERPTCCFKWPSLFFEFSYNLLCHPTITKYLKLKQTFHFSHRITCSTIDASLPRAKPHSSPRVTTALPSFTTIRFACFSSLRCANDFPCARLSGIVINGMLLQQRMDSFLNLWL